MVVRTVHKIISLSLELRQRMTYLTLATRNFSI